MKKLDELIANNLNPFTALHIKTSQTSEELEALFIKAASEGYSELIEKVLENTIEIEISPVECIMLMTKNNLVEFLDINKKIGIKYEMKNYINELFEMDNLNELLDKLDEENNLSDLEKEILDECFPGYIPQKIKAINIVNSVFESNFGVDDVLDRISTKGSGSLNEFHKNLLK
jgi:hypothetical protein